MNIEDWHTMKGIKFVQCDGIPKLSHRFPGDDWSGRCGGGAGGRDRGGGGVRDVRDSGGRKRSAKIDGLDSRMIGRGVERPNELGLRSIEGPGDCRVINTCYVQLFDISIANRIRVITRILNSYINGRIPATRARYPDHWKVYTAGGCRVEFGVVVRRRVVSDGEVGHI